MDDDELAEVPKGTLPVTQDILKKKILTDPDKAWLMLRENPVAVVALSRLRRELPGSSEENENSQEFFEIYEKKVDELFILNSIIETEGIALATEFINELWRREQQNFGFSTLAAILYKNIEKLIENTEFIENNQMNRVIREMVNYTGQRIIDYQEYDRMKAMQTWDALEPKFKEMIKRDFSDIPNELPEIWKSWFSLGTSTVLSAEVFRNNIGRLLLTEMKGMFPLLPEEMKYEIAPWILTFEKVNDENGNK